MNNITLLISDFDGTLVDTFEANFKAYQKAFREVGRELTEQKYRECFGFRFDRFMESAGVYDSNVRQTLKELKAEYYPGFFHLLKVNHTLLNFIRRFRESGGNTAIASTARGKNLFNALEYIGAIDDFNIILAGEDVSKGKPNPEIYLNVLNRVGVSPSEALVFEDSDVGFQAAEAAGLRYLRISSSWFY